MERTYIKDIVGKVGQEVKLNGFVHAIRDQGGLVFLILRDKTGLTQCIVKKSQEEVFEKAKEISLESVLAVTGNVKEEAQAPGGMEVSIQKIEILSAADPELPIPVVSEKSGDETEASKRFDWRFLDLRKPERQHIFKVWTELEKGYRKYFDENGFTQIYTPSFMISPSESGAEVFKVDYFDGKAYLAQSPQFYKQMAMASGFEKVFMVGPVYRAEPSFTTRHMTEFTGWDFEISYIDSHLDVMAEKEKLVVAGFTYLKESLGIDVEIPEIPFPKLTMAEAKDKLSEAGVPSTKPFDVSPEEEREICRLIKEETGNDFVWLTDYSIDVRPFYHMRYEDNPKTTKSFDLLYKGVEVVTGAQREHRYDVLLTQAKEKGMNLEELADYLNFFKYGCPPHGGIGFGPGRLIMQILDLPSVKEATYLPRDVKRLRP